MAVLTAPLAHADVAGRGSFTVGVGGVPVPPNLPFTGDLVFDSLPVTPLGSPVNLGVSVGQMTLTGTGVVDDAPPRATFLLTADDPDSTFAFDASGGGACEVPDCAGGTVTFAGRLDSVAPGFLPDGVITFDGTAGLAFPAAPAGVFGLNAFPSILTAEGSMVTVASGPSSYWDSRTQATRTFAAQATFDAVSAAGGTSFAGLSSVAGSPPPGITLSVPLSVVVDVETTAAVSGPVRICIAYGDADEDGVEDGSAIPVFRLRLLQAVAPTFVDVTTSAGDGLVCGTVASLSAFVVGVGDPSTTSTTISGGGTTTTLPLGGCVEALACLEVALAQPLCGGEPINPKLQAIIAVKLGKARSLLQKAAAGADAKVARLVARARKQLGKVGTKADAFVTKKKRPITAGCRDGIHAALDRIGGAITAANGSFHARFMPTRLELPGFGTRFPVPDGRTPGVPAAARLSLSRP